MKKGWRGVTLLYNVLLCFAFIPLVTYYGIRSLMTGKYRRNLAARLGWTQIPPRTGSRPRVWIHAVSVGEVVAAAPIVRALNDRLPNVQVLVSTTTETGQGMAQRVVTGAEGVFYFPLDLPFVVGSVLDRVCPQVVVLTETEIWPNFLAACRRRRIPVVLVNGRLSPRSFRRYQATRWFWHPYLEAITAAGMISHLDASRLIAMGMPPDRVRVLGNAKYDALATRVNHQAVTYAAQRLEIGPDDPVFLAGSTHEGEEEIVLSLYRRLQQEFPCLLLILVPRHIERSDAVRELCRAQGIHDLVTYREIMAGHRREGARVILVDVIGELFTLYGLATITFCGGSLVPKGGQNVLEAAVWGKVPLFGPHMDDFLAEQALLEVSEGGIMVRDGEELYETSRRLLLNPTLREERGEKGRVAVLANRGAAARYAELITAVVTTD